MHGKRDLILRLAEPLMLVLSPVVLAAAVLRENDYTALLSLFLMTLAIVPFFLRFESSRPKPRDIVPIVVLSAIASLGRALFVFLPSVQPATAIIIVSGLAFGPQAGFLTGALTALTSNMMLGQGPWTPWQMYAWGLSGYLAGVFQMSGLFRKTWLIYIYGFTMSIIYGWITNIQMIISFVRPVTWQSIFLVYLAGISSDLTHAVSTLVFLRLVHKPWQKKLERIKAKFGIVSKN